MTIQYSTAHRTADMTDLVTKLGTTGYLLIYSGSAPANCGTAASGTLLASLPLSNPVGTVTNGVLTLSAVTAAAAAATGTAGYFRLCTDSSGATCVAQGTVGTTGADLNFPSTSFTSGETISVSSFTITANGA